MWCEIFFESKEKSIRKTLKELTGIQALLTLIKYLLLFYVGSVLKIEWEEHRQNPVGEEAAKMTWNTLKQDLSAYEESYDWMDRLSSPQGRKFGMFTVQCKRTTEEMFSIFLNCPKYPPVSEDAFDKTVVDACW